MNAIGLLSALATVLGIAGIAGAALAWGRINLAKTTIELREQEVDALRGRLSTVELQQTTCMTELAALRAENDVLADHVTGATAIKESLAAMMAEHQRRHDEHLAQRELLVSILDAVRGRP